MFPLLSIVCTLTGKNFTKRGKLQLCPKPSLAGVTGPAKAIKIHALSDLSCVQMDPYVILYCIWHSRDNIMIQRVPLVLLICSKSLSLDLLQEGHLSHKRRIALKERRENINYHHVNKNTTDCFFPHTHGIPNVTSKIKWFKQFRNIQ